MAPDERSASSPALRFADVDLDREATPVLRGVNWQVSAGERWAVIGPNGSGKTTLMQLASGYLHPTRGTVEVLGQRLGRTDVRALRKRVSTVSASVARVIVPWLTAKEVVVSARAGRLGAVVAHLQRHRSGRGPKNCSWLRASATLPGALLACSQRENANRYCSHVPS